MKRVVSLFIFCILSLSLTIDAQEEELYQVILIEWSGIYELSEEYLSRYFPLEEGEYVTHEQIRDALAWVESRVDVDIAISAVETDNILGQGEARIYLLVMENHFGWRFNGGPAYAQVGKTNILNPGSFSMASIGYNRQDIDNDIPYLGAHPIGLGFSGGHELRSPFELEQGISEIHYIVSPYFHPIPELRIGADLGNSHFFDYAAEKWQHAYRVFWFLNGDFRYLADMYTVGFDFSFEIAYNYKGVNSSDILLNGSQSIYFKPANWAQGIFETGYAFVSESNYFPTTLSTPSTNYLASDRYGTRLLYFSLRTPVRILEATKTLTISVILQPEIFWFTLNDDSFSVNDSEIAFLLSPLVSIGQPVGIFLKPGIGYNLNAEEVIFNFEIKYNL